MNISQTSSYQGRQQITSIRAHISQKMKEFDNQNKSQDGHLLNEAYARALSGSKSAEKKYNLIENSKLPTNTTDFTQNLSNAFSNKYFKKRTTPKDHDLKNPAILSNSYKYQLNSNNQYVQVEKKHEESNISNQDDNFSHETKSQFTENAYDLGQRRTKSGNNRLSNQLVDENIDAKMAQQVLQKQVTQMTDEEFQQANFQQILSQFDQNSKADEISCDKQLIQISINQSEKTKPIDLDDLNQSNLSPQRSSTAYGIDNRQHSLNVQRKKYVPINQSNQDSLCEDPNYIISVIKIPDESQTSTDLFDATAAQASEDNVQAIKQNSCSTKTPIKSYQDDKKVNKSSQNSLQKFRKISSQSQSNTLNILAQKKHSIRTKSSKGDSKHQKQKVKEPSSGGVMLDQYQLQAAKINRGVSSKLQTPVIQYSSNSTIKRGSRNETLYATKQSSMNQNYVSRDSRQQTSIHRVSSQTSQKTRVKNRFNQLQSSQVGTPTQIPEGISRDLSQPKRSNSRGTSVTSSKTKYSYMQTTVSATAGAGMKPIQAPLNADIIMADMVSAFTKVRLDLYQDILRIKKPQAQAFTASQMLCKLVNSFRGGSQKTNNESMFQEWQSIQDFVHRKPNVIKFNQEITQLIQHMILSQDYLKQLKTNQLKNHLNKLIKIQSQYFGLDSHNQVLKQFINQKNFKNIVNIVFTIIRYVLFQAGRLDLINMGDKVEEPEESQHKSQNSGKFVPVRQQSGSWSKAVRSTSMQKAGSAEKDTGYLSKQSVATRKQGNKIRVSGIVTNAQVTPKSSHKDRYDPMNRSQNISKSVSKNMMHKPPQMQVELSGTSSGFADQHDHQIDCRNMSYASSISKLPPAHQASRTSSAKPDQRNQPKKLYEIMLEKQKKILSNTKYEKLNLSSVGKRRHNASSQQSRRNDITTPGSNQSQNKSEPRQCSQDESANIIINHSGYNIKTPVRNHNESPRNHNDSPTPEASQIKYTPLVHRYNQEKSPAKRFNSPEKSPIQQRKEGTGTRSRARKSRKERQANSSMSQANNSCNFSNAIISAHQEIDAIKNSIEQLQNEPSQVNQMMQEHQITSIMEIPSPNDHLASIDRHQVDSQTQSQQAYFKPSFLLPLQMKDQKVQVQESQEQSQEQIIECLPLQMNTANPAYKIFSTEESENFVIRQIQMKAPQPYEKDPTPLKVAQNISVKIGEQQVEDIVQGCETKRLQVNLGESESDQEISKSEEMSSRPQENSDHEQSCRSSHGSPQIDKQAEAHKIACYIKFEVDQESESVSPQKNSEIASPQKDHDHSDIVLIQTSHATSMSYNHSRMNSFQVKNIQTHITEISPEANDLLSDRTDEFTNQNCPNTIHNGSNKQDESNQYAKHKFHVDDESIKTHQESLQKMQCFVDETEQSQMDNYDQESEPNFNQTSHKLSIPNQSIAYDQVVIESNNQSPQFVKKQGAHAFNLDDLDDTEDSPEPRQESPKRICQNHQTKIESSIKEKEESLSEENSEMCMQEIVSPFREMRLAREDRHISPEERKQAIENNSSKWQINPIQVRREDSGEHEDATPRVEYSVQEENLDDVYSSPGGSSASPCESPVRQPQYVQNAARILQMKLNEQSVKGYENQYTSKQISPGKLKQEVSKQRAHIMDQLDAIQKDIEDNSPSKNPVIDRDLIAKLKERRLQNRAGQQKIFDQESQKNYQDQVIKELQKSIVKYEK